MNYFISYKLELSLICELISSILEESAIRYLIFPKKLNNSKSTIIQLALYKNYSENTIKV